jgi:hypothetical protein
VGIFLDGNPARPFLDGRNEIRWIEMVMNVDDHFWVNTGKSKHLGRGGAPRKHGGAPRQKETNTKTEDQRQKQTNNNHNVIIECAR